MQDKIILIAHRDATVRDRFAAALADARHTFVTAATAETATEAARDQATPISLGVVDIGLTAVTANVNVGTTNGGVTLRLPADAKALLLGRTTNGGISVDDLQVDEVEHDPGIGIAVITAVGVEVAGGVQRVAWGRQAHRLPRAAMNVLHSRPDVQP